MTRYDWLQNVLLRQPFVQTGCAVHLIFNFAKYLKTLKVIFPKMVRTERLGTKNVNLNPPPSPFDTLLPKYKG